MNREKITNDINKLTNEIIDMLEDEADLIEFKKTLAQVLVSLKYTKELAKRLKGEE